MRTISPLATAVLLSGLSSVVHGAPLRLADHGQTSYTIVAGTARSDVDKLAVVELQTFLQESTGASFPVISGNDPQVSSRGKRIVVGDSVVAQRILGKDVIAGLKDQQSLVRTFGDDLVLLGGGLHGTLYAVYSFLEHDLGCRWYTAYRDNYTPRHTTLDVPAIQRIERPAFTFRHLSNCFYPAGSGADLFFYRNGLNTALERGDRNLPGIKDLCPLLAPNVHSLFYYISPGDVNPGWAGLPKPSAKNFFKTNPEFFSLDQAGKRVDTLQLCFSNRNLRKTFTAHLLERIKAGGGRGIVNVSANDVPGSFCHCPACMALEKQYQSVGGPLFDYLIEACEQIAKAYPRVYVTTLAYRKNQTEVPPAVKRLPDNLIIVFAPIDDNFAATLDDPTNRGTLDNLKKWVSIAKHVWVWYYVNPYILEHPPLGNVEKAAADTKLLRHIGVSGTFYEHDSAYYEHCGMPGRYNFTELQTWLLLKLFQNPDREVWPLVEEFTAFYYGPAAPRVRSYLAELESLRKQMKTGLSWFPSPGMYRYLTPENIVRWQKSFDRMEKVAADSPQPLSHVRQLRMTLDMATLDHWLDISKRFPENGMSVELLENRIKGQPGRCQALNNLLDAKVLVAAGRIKAVPAPLDVIPPARLRQAFPPSAAMKADPEAALAYAVKGEVVETPLTLGIYDTHNGKATLSTSIPAEQLKPGRYRVYKVGQTTLSPQCCFWLTQQWFCTIPLEQFYVMGDPFKKWDVYASIKVDGPGYGHSAKGADKNVVACDRVILVECQE